jgi:regulator of PEP synthase PpsR (kinase-PPPase family)
LDADEEAVREEITQANRLFQRNNWKTIDVSRRSVEETAAAILNLLNERRAD